MFFLQINLRVITSWHFFISYLQNFSFSSSRFSTCRHFVWNTVVLWTVPLLCHKYKYLVPHIAVIVSGTSLWQCYIIMSLLLWPHSPYFSVVQKPSLLHHSQPWSIYLFSFSLLFANNLLITWIHFIGKTGINKISRKAPVSPYTRLYSSIVWYQLCCIDNDSSVRKFDEMCWD